MRITFVLPAFNLSGGSRVLATHAERLRRRGHQVLAVAPRQPSGSVKDFFRTLLRAGHWPANPNRGPSHFDGLGVEHRRLKREGTVTDADLPDADVIIGSWWESVRWITQLSPAKGAKVHFVQGYEVFGGPKEEVQAVYRLPLPKIVISEWLRGIIQGEFGQTPIALVPNSVDTQAFHAPPRGKQTAPTVGLIYSTMGIKGTDVSLRAYELAARQVPNLRLLAMSEISVSPELPLPPGAEFISKAREQKLRETYARCDAWLVGTREEGFGLPILEAMACRTPVIATPAGAAPQLLSKGGGLLVPHEDPEAMARAIVQVCSLPEDAWRALSDAALATASGYTWDDAAHLFEQALCQVVERCRSGKENGVNS